MIGSVTRAIDNFLGRGEAAVTVPPLDGALRANRILDEAEKRFQLHDADGLVMLGGRLLASAGDTVHVLEKNEKWKRHFKANCEITCITPVDDDGLALGLSSGEIIVAGGAHDGMRLRASPQANCLTAMVEADGVLYAANGSRTNAPGDWQRDLLERNASGSLWRIDLASGKPECLAEGLAWPAGLALDGNGLVVSEAWEHRLVRHDPANAGRAETLYHGLPGYPGRLSLAAEGWWLAVFAPRSQLVEFVLREPAYRRRMLDEVPQPYWISPKLRSGRIFYEPLQGGGVKHLGLLKPWSPTMSAGMCVKLDNDFQPVASLHSRADGSTHGITSVLEIDGGIYAAARGDNVVVHVPGPAAGEAA